MMENVLKKLSNASKVFCKKVLKSPRHKEVLMIYQILEEIPNKTVPVYLVLV